MNSNIFRQADSRWGSLPYPSKPYTLARSGCGCVSVTHCAIEQQKYWNYTPKDVRPYMVQFATRGHGTLWAGIKKGLEHYGYNVYWATQSTPMSDVWKVLNGKSLKRGIILFGSTKGPDKTVWTEDGHFISFVDYKLQNNQHWFYLKDSGGRHHDKWWCYEKSMKGDVRQVWICTSVKETPKVTKPTGTYSGAIPKPTLKKGSKGNEVINLQKFLNWYHPAWALKADGDFGGGTESALKSFQATEGILDDGVYGKNSQAKANAYKASTPAPTPTPTPKPVTTPAKKKYTGKIPSIPEAKIIECTRSVNGMRTHKLIKGSYILRFKSEEHRYKMCKFSRVTVANKKISYNDYPKFEDKVKAFGYNLEKLAALKTSANCSNFIDGAVGAVTGKYVRDLGAKKNKKYLTATGLFTAYNYSKGALLAGDICGTSKHTWMIIQGSAISIGCAGTEVKQWQAFLNWAGFNCGTPDGDFGMKTATATKGFQKATGLTQDGVVGSKTIAKAKVYER